jgi:hypothetical protein
MDVRLIRGSGHYNEEGYRVAADELRKALSVNKSLSTGLDLVLSARNPIFGKALRVSPGRPRKSIQTTIKTF